MEAVKKGISGHQLKMLAIFLMIFDHIHQMFAYAGAPLFFTMLGRPVMTVFLFTSAEGFYYTRDKKKYLLRLLYFYWIMNLLNYIISNLFPLPPVSLTNNVFGTLLVGAIGMFGIDFLRRKQWLQAAAAFAVPVLPSLLEKGLHAIRPEWTFDLSLLFPSYSDNEGGRLMIVLAICLYLFRGQRLLQYLFILLAAVRSSGLMLDQLWTTDIQWMMIFSILPLSLYNGTKGTGSKSFFYFFYPAHIYLLYLLSYFYYSAVFFLK